MNNDLLTHLMSRCEMLCRSRDFITHDMKSICSSAPKIEEGIYKSILLQLLIFLHILYLEGSFRNKYFMYQNIHLEVQQLCLALKGKYITISNGDVICVSNLNLASSVQFSSAAQSCPTLCNPMNCSTPGLPVHHQLLEFTKTHAHRVSDAIQPSHPRSSPSPPAPNPSQHQGLFQRVNSSHQVAKVLEFQLQHRSFQ